MLFEDKNRNVVVVELKLDTIGRDAKTQLQRYMHRIGAETKKNVRGIIVCKDVLPAFEKEFKKLADIRIFHYGWKLTVYPREWE